MGQRDMQWNEKEVNAARRDVEADIAALGSTLREDERIAKSRARSSAPALVGGAAAIGLLVGFGGSKALKILIGLGIIAATIAVYARRAER